MATFEQTGDGGSAGASVGTVNTAGAVSTAFASIVNTAGTFTFDNTFPFPGTLPMKSVPSGSGASYGQWTINGAAWVYRGYHYLPVAPDAEIGIAWLGVGTTRASTLTLQATTGRLIMRNSAGTSVGGAGTVDFPLNRWVLVQWKGTISATVGTSDCAFYDIDHTTVLDSRSATGANFGASNITVARVPFRTGTSSQTITHYATAIKFADTGSAYFGPYVPASVTGTIGQALPRLAQSASGTRTVPIFTGATAQSLAHMTQAAVSTRTTPAFTGTATSALPRLTQAASGTRTNPPGAGGSIGQTLPHIGQAATGTRTIPTRTAVAAQTFPHITQVGTGTRTAPVFTGTGTQSLQPVAQSVVATYVQPVTGSINVTLPHLAQSASGTRTTPVAVIAEDPRLLLTEMPAGLILTEYKHPALILTGPIPARLSLQAYP